MDPYTKFVSAFDRQADKTFIIDVQTGQRLTYAGFLNRSLKTAAWLEARGIKAGDTVLISCSNSVNTALLYFGCLHTGIQIVPVNPNFDDEDISQIIKDTAPALSILEFNMETRAPAFVPADWGGQIIYLQSPRTTDEADVGLVSEIADFRPRHTPFSGFAGSDVFLTAYSSGTTAKPKGIDITLNGMLGGGLAYIGHMGLDSDCRFYNTLPMTYMGGYFNLLLLPVLSESSIAIDAVFGPTNVFSFWLTVAQYEINTLWFSGAMLSMLLEADRGDDLSFLRDRVRFTFCGFAPLTNDVRQQFEARTGLRIFENYASSECLFITANRPGTAYKGGSKGVPLDGVDLSIVKDNGQKCAVDEEGEIQVNSPYRMAGYVAAAPEDRAKVTSDGFLTGDLGLIDEDGELFITGRVKDLIIRGGINISPASIEDALCSHDAIAEAAVIGAPDKVYGERIIAFVTQAAATTAQPSERDLQKHCKQNLSAIKIPAEYHFLDDLPRNHTGKVNKNTLRAIYPAFRDATCRE